MINLRARRQALMAGKLIRGADLDWEQGTILDDGPTTSSYAIRTRLPLLPMRSAKIRYTGPAEDDNAVLTTFVVEYDAAGEFIQRSFLRTAQGADSIVTLQAATRQVRFVFAHPLSSSVRLAVDKAPLFQIRVYPA